MEYQHGVRTVADYLVINEHDSLVYNDCRSRRRSCAVFRYGKTAIFYSYAIISISSVKNQPMQLTVIFT